MNNLEPVSVIICRVGEQYYAISVADILEVAALVQLTPLPNAPREVLGVVNRHGMVIPILDLRLCLGQEAPSLSLATMFVVVQGAGYTAGLIVDDVQAVVAIPPERLSLPAKSGPFVQGMAAVDRTPLLVLDVAALLRQFAVSEVA
jgi:purine-binding chemotaxis protein CheW